MSPFFTVGIPVYNRVQAVRDAVESVLAQTDRDFELVVVDNASTDGTWEYLQGLTDPRVRVFRNDTNVGMVPNWRRCVEEARGSWFKFLMSDDVLFPWALPTIRGLLERFPDCRVVVAAGVNFKGAIPRPAQVEAEPRFFAVQELRDMARRFQILPASNPNAYTLSTAEAKAMIATPQYRQVEERLGATGHDVDFFMLYWCALRSPRVVYHPAPLYGVRYHDGNGAKRYFYDLAYRWEGDQLVRRLLFPTLPRSRRRELAYLVTMLQGIGLDFVKSLILRRPRPGSLWTACLQFARAAGKIAAPSLS